MKRFFAWTGGTVLLAGGGFAGYAAFQEPTTLPGTKLDGLVLEGLTRVDLQKKLNFWWQSKRLTILRPHSRLLSKQPEAVSLAEMGVTPDWVATMATVRFRPFAEGILPSEERGSEIQVSWRIAASESKRLADFVKSVSLPVSPASITFANGVISRKYEVTSFELDEDNVADAALDAIKQGKTDFELPMQQGQPRIPNAAVDSITDIVSQFTTRFNLGQGNRSSNIKLATSRFNGRIIMPGEVLSYNDTVGKRTMDEGFKLAGVYKNGKHDTGIGGGICQVSTTLFNAAAFANLGIVSRSNHSMPVAYVPVGRDATVDYGSIDLKIKNTMDTPIAISSETNGGSVTFRILGKKQTGLKVSLTTSNHSSWANTIQYVTDPSVPVGKVKIIEKGSIGRRCLTWRTVVLNGKVVKREQLCSSLYRPSARIVARAPVPKQAPGGPKPAEIPTPDIGD